MEEAGIRLREFAMTAAAAVLAANGGAAPPPRERKYRGVRRHRGNQNHSADIRDPSGGRDSRKLWLGGYDSAVEAACVYDAAVRTLRPDEANARTNIPEPNPEEKEKRAAVVMAYVDELKRKREEEEAALLDADAVSAVSPPPPASPAPAGGATSSPSAAAPAANRAVASTAAPPPPAPATAPAPPPAFGFHHTATAATCSTTATAFTRNPQAHRSAFRPYRSNVGSPRQGFPTTGGCTMANVPPAQFQNLYLRFVGASGHGDGSGSDSDPGTHEGLKATELRRS